MILELIILLFVIVIDLFCEGSKIQFHIAAGMR